MKKQEMYLKIWNTFVSCSMQHRTKWNRKIM